MTLSAVLKRWALLVLGLALIVVAFALANQPVSYGWFGAPDGAFLRFPADLVVVPTAAAAAFTLGVVLIAGWIGFRLGNRPQGNDSDS